MDKIVIDQILHHGYGMYLNALSNNQIPDADTLHFTHLPMVANSFYDSRFTARHGDSSTTLLIEDN